MENNKPKLSDLILKTLGFLLVTLFLAPFSAGHFYRSALSLEPISYGLYVIATVGWLFLLRKMPKLMWLIYIPLAILTWVIGFLWAPFYVDDGYVHPCVEMNKEDPSTNYCAV